MPVLTDNESNFQISKMSCLSIGDITHKRKEEAMRSSKKEKIQTNIKT